VIWDEASSVVQRQRHFLALAPSHGSGAQIEEYVHVHD